MLSFTKSRLAGKTFLQTLFFFLLVTQICFAQWVQLGLEDKGIKDIAARNSTIFAVTSDSGKLYRSMDSGTNWTMVVDTIALDFVNNVAIASSGKVFMVKDNNNPNFYASALLSSLDNGGTWVQSNIMEQLIDSIPWGYPTNISVSPEGIIFCHITSGWAFFIFDNLAKSTDDGVSWTTPGWSITGGLLFDFRNQFVITVGGGGGGGGGWASFYLSSDFGNTWAFSEPPGSGFRALGLFSNGNIILGGDFMVGSNSLKLSTDMCVTWMDIATLNHQVGLSWSNGSSEGMLVGTSDLGVFLFSDEGDSLGSRNEGLTNLNVQALTLDNNGYVYAGTDNGVWRRPLSEATSVEEHSTTLLSSYILSQNFPNPFNPSTVISYQLPIGGNVTLKIYDILGNDIATLVSEFKPAGKYESEFNAVNLPSGVYFYQLKAGDFIQTRKMILLK